jgi:pimeloyl-ACP methyl ester carboxylesterase
MSKRMLVGFIVSAALLLALSPAALAQGETEVTTGYVDVNDLHMYYEIRGTGEPLVVLHGAYMSIDTMSMLIQPLAQTRQVIAVELQGHGRTNDVEGRPLNYAQLAEDVAAFMTEIGIEKADFLGYSMGANTALHVAVQHPDKVDKLVLISGNYRLDGLYPDLIEFMKIMTPDMFAGTPMVTEYERLSPNPDGFATLVQKVSALDIEMEDLPAEALQGITAPTLIIAGDSDATQPEHAVDMFRVRGGGVNGDLAGLPNAQLAILPGTTHISVLMRTDWVIPMTVEFLDGTTPAPMMG